MAAIEKDIMLLSPDGSLHPCHIRFHPGIRPPRLEVLDSPIGNGCYQSGDLWWALIDFRRAIEPSGWRVLCCGSRRDVWPSGMSADMSNGLIAYELDPSLGNSGLGKVRTFDPATAEAVCSVEEQIMARDAFHERNGRLRTGH